MSVPSLQHPSAARAALPLCVGCEQPVERKRCDACGAAQQAGELTIERVLHRSFRGRVYLARTASGLKVALKELVFARAPEAAVIDAFEREGQVLVRLEHPGIPRFVGTFQEGEAVEQRFYRVQEYAPGESALQRVARARFFEREALQVGEQLLEVLEYLHGRTPRLVHRDLKPANVILRPQGDVALVDFDTARDLGSAVTHRSTWVGTAGDTQPEQYGGTVGPASDLYAVGATLIHLLTGEPPPIPVPGRKLDFAARASVCPATVSFLHRLTAWDAKERFASAARARETLRALVASLRASRGGWLHPIATPPGEMRALPPDHHPVSPAPAATPGPPGHPSAAGVVIINGEPVGVSRLGEARREVAVRAIGTSPVRRKRMTTADVIVVMVLVAGLVLGLRLSVCG